MSQTMVEVILRTVRKGEDEKAFKKELKDIQAGLNKVKVVMLAGAAAVAAATYKYIEYATTVRDVTIATGATAEEASRMIQVADDLGVSISTLEMAMKTMAKDGIALTFDELVKLSGEFALIEDPAKRAKLALDKFGKSGMDMLKIMEEGPEKLKAMGDAAGNILSQKDIEEAEDMRRTFDELQDSLTELVFVLVKELLPAIKAVVGGVAAVVGEIGFIVSSGDAIADSLQKLSDVAGETSKTYEEYLGWISPSAEANKMLAASVDWLTEEEFKALKNKQEAAEYTERYNKILAEHARGLKGIGSAIAGLDYTAFGREIDKAADAQERLRASTETYRTLLRGEMTSENKNFEEQMGDLTFEAETLQDKIHRLAATPNRTPEQDAQLQEYKNQLGGVVASMDEVEKAHKRATDQIVLGWMEQALAADGSLDQQDINILMGQAVAWGLITEEERKAYTMAQNYANLLRNWPAVVTTTFNAVLGALFGGGGPPPIEGANGWNGVVSQPTLFLAGEENKPERVNITPLGKGGGAKGGGGVVIEQVVISDEMSLARFEGMLRRVMKN